MKRLKELHRLMKAEVIDFNMDVSINVYGVVSMMLIVIVAIALI